MLKLNREVLNLVQSCQGMYQRMELRVSPIFPLCGTDCILTYWEVKSNLLHSHLLPHSCIVFVAGTSTRPQLSMARHPIACYTPTVKVYSIQLRTGSIVSSNYVVLRLLEVRIYRSGRSKLPPRGKIGTIAVQSLLLRIIFAQVWYEMGQWRKIIRFSCTSWRFFGYLNTSWRLVLEFEQTTTQITNNIIKRHWYTTTA